MSRQKIVAVNASPRQGWNTDILVSQAAAGAEHAGAEVERVELYRLKKFTGCISCFSCKRKPNEGVTAHTGMVCTASWSRSGPQTG